MCALLAVSALSVFGVAQAYGDGVDGRALYQGYLPFRAGIEATSLHLPARFAACAGCHGVSAEGSLEGNVQTPSLKLSALLSRRGSSDAYTSDEAVLRAVTDGVGRGGAALATTMPRYRLSTDEGRALLSYLRRVGTPDDLPSGVDRRSIRLMTILPLSGPQARAAASIRRGLDDIFDKINAVGGIYGRSIRLDVVDAMNVSLDAVLRPESRPYAVIAGMWRTSEPSLDRTLAEHRISKIGSLDPKGRVVDIDDWEAELLPPLDVQQQRLVATLKDCVAEKRFAIPVQKVAIISGGEAVEWLEGWTALVAMSREHPPGCAGYGMVASPDVAEPGLDQWEQHAVAPFPLALLQSGPDVWLTLGRAAARFGIELLSRAGAHLSENSLVVAARGLNGFAPQPNAPVQFTRSRRYAWDADVEVRLPRPDPLNVDRPPTVRSNQGG